VEEWTGRRVERVEEWTGTRMKRWRNKEVEEWRSGG
jgi:hypothetical protein